MAGRFTGNIKNHAYILIHNWGGGTFSTYRFTCPIDFLAGSFFSENTEDPSEHVTKIIEELGIVYEPLRDESITITADTGSTHIPATAFDGILSEYTIKSVKHSETFVGTRIDAIVRAREIDAEYSPAFGVQVENSSGETVWDSEEAAYDAQHE